MSKFKFSFEVEQEEDGRWIAEVMEIPGALSYGQSVQQALVDAESLALRVLAEKSEADGYIPAFESSFSSV